MYREFILQNFQTILFILLALFFAVKAILIFYLNTDTEGFAQTFFRLLFIQRKDTIKNAIGRAKKLYGYSNIANRVFYIILGLFLLLYFLMASL